MLRRAPEVRGFVLAAGVVLAVQVLLTIGALRQPLELYDEGISLSTARFVSEGLLPYRDFHYPYGPGLAYLDAGVIRLGLDHLVVHRLVWAVAGAALSILVLRLAFLRRQRAVGLAVVALLLVAPVPASYVFAALLTVGTITLLQTRPGVRGVLLLLAAACWFRWEYAVVLGLVSVLLFAVDRERRRAVFGWAGLAAVVAVAPYVVLAALGGWDGLREQAEYTLGSFGEFRGLPYPWSAPVDLVRDVLAGSVRAVAVDLALVAGYLVAPAALLAAAVLSVRRSGMSAVLRRPAVLVALSWAMVSLYSLRVRADVEHVAPLIVALGVALILLLPTGIRWAQGTAVITAAVALLLAVPIAADSLTDDPPGPDGLDQVIARAGELLDGGPLFVAGEDNSLTYMNAVALYWALDATPASPVFQFEPGSADQEDVQQGIVRDLCRTRPVVVLWDAPVGAEVRGRSFSDELDDFLATAYDEVWHQGEFSILVPTPDGC